MIDLDAIELAARNPWYCRSSQDDNLLQPGTIIELIASLRQAEKDAARYRWLRDESAFTHDNAPLAFFTDTNGDQIAFDFDGSSYSVLHNEMLDAAIDEAMQCK